MSFNFCFGSLLLLQEQKNYSFLLTIENTVKEILFTQTHIIIKKLAYRKIPVTLIGFAHLYYYSFITRNGAFEPSGEPQISSIYSFFLSFMP